jgi:hypothetical protein
MSSHQKKNVSSSIYSSFEYHLRNPAWKNLLRNHRIPWRNETHSEPVVEFTRESIYFLHKPEWSIKFSWEHSLSASSPFLSSYRQVRHSWVHTGKFAILEFTPASSPFLSSHRQVRQSWVHTGKLAIIVHTGKIRQVFQFISARFAKFELISARFAKFELISARFAKFWVNIGKIRQVLSAHRQGLPNYSVRLAAKKVYTASLSIPAHCEWIHLLSPTWVSKSFWETKSEPKEFGSPSGSSSISSTGGL